MAIVTGILLVLIVGDWIFFCVGELCPQTPPGSMSMAKNEPSTASRLLQRRNKQNRTRECVSMRST